MSNQKPKLGDLKPLRRELSSNKRVEIRPGEFGSIVTAETISVPQGKAVIVSLRRKFADQGLTMGAGEFAKWPFTGQLTIRLSNRSGHLAEINEGEAFVNFLVVHDCLDDIIVE